MCGIVGYIGNKKALPILIEGLKKLEYRGYDSAGVALIEGNVLKRERAAGKIVNLESKINGVSFNGNIGLGHTRWATHGRPTEENAHPHTDCNGEIVVVHNGIIENYLQIKKTLAGKGHTFKTDTDTEVIAHLIEEKMKGDLTEAVRLACGELHGIFAISVISSLEPDKIIATRMGPPLVIGLGNDENFVASDIPAILSYTRDIAFLADGEMAIVTSNGIQFKDMDGNPKIKSHTRIQWDSYQAEKGGYKHFMLKEIYEQPRAIRDTLIGRISLENAQVFLDGVDIDDEFLKKIERISIIACGTSWHAGLCGKYMIEELARVPVEVDYASEFRYRKPIIQDRTLCLFISQSGETADTLAAIREAKAHGAKTLAICNVVGSMLTREADATLYTHAGPEIGVASTKAFTTQLICLYLISLHFASLKKTITQEEMQGILLELHGVVSCVEKALDLDEKIEKIARHLYKATDFLFLGRGILFPVALEGALKLKEISYIHAEGYPAGEMKHGPIALIDENLPVVALVPPLKPIHDKVLSNIEEVKAREGYVIALAEEGDDSLKGKADEILFLPKSNQYIFALSCIVPLQLLAYHIAVKRGCDVDQPRNLAKSVTVE